MASDPFPGAPGEGLQNEEPSGPVMLGTHNLAVPGTNGSGQPDAAYWKSTGIGTIPANTWVYIHVNGGVTHHLNGDCKYRAFECTGHDGATTGPLNTSGSGQVRIGYRNAALPPPNPSSAMAEYTLYPIGGTPETAMQAGALVRTHQPTTIWARRIVVWGGNWDPFLGGGGFQYYLTGNQTLTVSRVPTPLEVEAPPAVQPGVAAAFNAKIVGGFRFRRQGGTYGDSIYWIWFRNDTMPEPNPHLPGTIIPRCGNQTSCAYAPSESGRMGMFAHVEANTLDVRGPITRVEPLRVTLSCTPSSVVRAANVDCEATWTPSSIPAGDIEFAWRFDADSVRVFPDPAAQAFDPPPSVDTTASGLRTWSGQVVIGGRVSVSASAAGASSTDSARIAVNRRTGTQFGDLPVTMAGGFTDVPTDSTLPLASQPHPEPGGGPGMVGQNYDTNSTRGDLSRAIHGTPTLAAVSSGPNAGYWYVMDPNVRSTRGARLRTWITGNEAPKFRYPTVPDLLTNRGLLAVRRTHLNPHAPRMHNDSTEFFLGVLAHETYGRNGRKGHQGQIELAAKSEPTCGRAPALLERVVALDSAAAGAASRIVLGEGRTSLYAAAWHNHVYGNYSNAPFYEVVSTVTNAAHLQHMMARGDSVTPPHAGLAPNPRYRCTRVY